MSWTCDWTSASQARCVVDASGLDWLGSVLQVGGFVAGAVLAIGVGIAIFLVLRTMTEND